MIRRHAAALTAIALLALVAALAGVRAVTKSRTWQAFGTLVHRGPATARRVALTFDDGPTAARGDTILAILAARNVRATFFVTGRELAAAPEVGKRLVAAGHELGNHTWTHRRMFLVRPATVRAELEPTDSLIRAMGQRGAIDFRPPYGYKFLMLPWYLMRTGRTTVMWDAEPDSWPDVAATPEGIVAHVLARVRPGSIILLHPWYSSRQTSLAAIGPLVDSLQARGYHVGTVQELLR